MIVITGPGRSGTSVLAQLYLELGFDPGGNWIKKVNAGLEHGEFWRLNNKIAKAAGSTMLHPPKGEREVAPLARPPGVKGKVTKGRRKAARKLSPDPKPRKVSLGTGRVRLINWNRTQEVLDKFGDEMVRLAKETPVVKDPRFTFTLPFWIAAGAEIEHVTVTTRNIDQMVNSRKAAEQSEFNEVELRNALTYGMGVITTALVSNDISHSYIRFPDFLHDLDALYDALRFPGPCDRDRFKEVAAKIFDPDQVHWTPPGS